MLLAARRGPFLGLDGLPPRDRAAAGFAWVVRQVQLRDAEQYLCPPLFVLRRGWGSATERALVFLALLHQMGIDGCLIGNPPFERHWAAGALVNEDVWLFDLQRGEPVPGPKGQGMATLAQVRTDAELSLPREARQAEAHLVCSLSALAPRMRYLQQLVGATEPVALETDPALLLRKFQAALRGPAFAGRSVRVWNPPRDPNSPLRLVRCFLPPEDGGIDRSQRKQRTEVALIPWDRLPDMVRDLPGEPGNRLQTLFGRPFVTFLLEGACRANLLLRGQLDEAVRKLVEVREQLRQQRNALRAERDLEAEAAAWCRQAAMAHAALTRAAERASQDRRPEALAALETAQARMNALLQDSQKPVLFVQSAAAEPMGARVAFLLALCQQEKAERDQLRQDRARFPQAAALLGAWPETAFPGTLPWAGCLLSSRKDGALAGCRRALASVPRGTRRVAGGDRCLAPAPCALQALSE